MAFALDGATAHHETGQGIVEYGGILGLSAVVTIVVLVFMGATLADVLAAIGRAIDAASRSN